MIQLANLTEITESDIPSLLTKIEQELKSRKDLWKRYHRKDSASSLVYGGNGTKVAFEKYITDIACGFLGGNSPTYTIDNTIDEKKINAVRVALDKEPNAEGYADEMDAIINYISKYNDDGTEHYEIVKDILMLRGGYEIVYENQNNEIVYSRLDPLQTVAIWDYSTPCNLLGLIRTWKETDIKNVENTIVEITDISGTRKYVSNGKEYAEIEDARENNNWGDVPAFAVEIDECIYEPVVELIEAYEQLIQNTRNMFQYNDDAKLAISGYEPENEITVTDEDGNVKINPARQQEDKFIRNAPVMYFNDGGSANWLIKDINDSAIQNTLKTYIDLIMMNSGVPNTFDLGFTNADNASAIDRKFFSLTSMTVNIMQQLKKAYLRRWELILGRVNLKKSTMYDFRDINVEILPNLPANESEMIDMWLKLRGVISDETIINRLPLNLEYASERNKMDEETTANLEKNIELMALGGMDNGETLPTDRQETETDKETI